VSGRVIVLNGTSSSGKTSLGRALQDRLDGTWLLLGIDTFITALPWKLYGTPEGHTINGDGTIDFGGTWHEERRRWRAAVASLARAGSNLLLDEVFTDGAVDQQRWAEALDGVEVTWVGVHVDVEVAAAREQARGDRDIGMARQQALVVHAGVRYDVEVDSTSSSPEELAAQIQTG
jgi:chloramphenicol 3-O phosphotransferase